MMPTETPGLTERQEGWIIEGAGVAWCGRSLHDFRPNYQDAVRFARERDAYLVLNWILPEEYRRVCRPACHLWVPPAN